MITGRVRVRIEAEGVEVEVWDRSRVEPTADSLQAADSLVTGHDPEEWPKVKKASDYYG